MRFYTLFFLIFLASYNPAFSGAWVLDKGENLFIHTLYTYESDIFVNSEGKKSKVDKYSKYDFNTYVEYGLTEDITLGFNTSYQFAEYGVDKNRGLGDTEFFIRTPLYDEFPKILSLQATVKIPTLSNELSPRIGTYGWDTQLDLLYGQSFNNGFLDTGIGYRKRFSSSADQIKWYAKYGFVINEDLTIIPAIYGTHKVGKISKEQVIFNFENDYDLIKTEVTAVYDFYKEWSFELGGYKDIYSRNTGEGYGGIIGVWKRF